MSIRLASMGVLLLALASSGCGLMHTGASVLTHKTRETLDDHAEMRRNEKWAKQAWREVVQGCGEGTFSKHHAHGFRDGFADHLYRGGDGEPPALPPFEYRKLHNQTPAGYQATLDWFAGYRHGALVAKQGGFRELVTGPSVLRAAGPLTPVHPPGPVGPAEGSAPIAPALPPPTPIPTAPTPQPAPTPAPAAPRTPQQMPPGPERQAGTWTMTVDFTPWRR